MGVGMTNLCTNDKVVCNMKRNFRVAIIITTTLFISRLSFNSNVIQDYVAITTDNINGFISEEFTVHRWPNPDRIFYNRVPKCGSSTATAIFQQLAKVNNYSFHFELGYPGDYHTDAYEHLKSWYFKPTIPSLVIDHLHFFNFSRFGHSSPTYINLIRDPLDRLTSFYYFIRYQPGHERTMPMDRRQMLYNECVEKRDAECVGSENYFVQIPFFCGIKPECRVPGPNSLAIAKQNVLRHYAVVGYTEDIRGFLLALEWMFPKWFHGATSAYDYSVLNNLSYKMKTIQTPSRNLTQSNHEYMTSLLKEEYEFYRFIKQRFVIYRHRLKMELPESLVDQNQSLKKIRRATNIVKNKFSHLV